MFAEVVLGHLIGDYIFQSKSMALKKTEKGLLGIAWCTLHSLVYTSCVCLFMWDFRLLLIILIFISHWPIDRWSLASKWLKLIHGRDFFTAYKIKNLYWEIDLSFSCLVYAVVDNTMHLVLLWFTIKWFV